MAQNHLLAYGAMQDSTRESGGVTPGQADREYLPAWHAMFTNIPGNYLRFGRDVLKPEAIPIIIAVTASTAILIVTDEETYRWHERAYLTSPVTKDVSDIAVWIGDGRPQFGLAAAFGLYGFVANDARSLRTASQIVEAILSVGIIVQILKHTTGRESPLVSTIPGGRWQWFPNQIEYHKHVPHYDAFPSGHVATALATFTVIAENYPEIWWIRPAGYALTGLLAVAMVNTGIHWYSDYPLAIAMGYSFGMIAAHPVGMSLGSESTNSHVQFSILPYISSGQNGVEVVLSF